MKLLTLIRHAKSSWSHPHLSDHDRPLNRRGRHDAPMMGLHLKTRHLVISRILSSTATRAVQTATLIAQPLGYPTDKIQTLTTLYAASARQLLEVIRQQEDGDHLALVGHNPGISELAAQLANTSTHDMPTCAVLQLKFDLSHWETIATHSGHIQFYDTPKHAFKQ